MPSLIAWKRKRKGLTDQYAGSTGSERRDAAKRDLYSKGLIDSPTEDALNRYVKRGKGQKEYSSDSESNSRPGSYLQRQQQIAANQSGMGNGSYGSSTEDTGNFYNTAVQGAAQGDNNMAGGSGRTYNNNDVSGSGLPAGGPNAGSGVQPGTKSFGPIDPSQYASDWQQQIYSPSNPEEAMYNSLADAGVASWDPLVQEAYIPAAKGLASAFTLQQAMGGMGGGQGLPGTDFRNFLGGLLAGGGGGGGVGIYGALQNAMRALGGGSLVDMLKQGATIDPTGKTIQNPYLASLLPLLSNPDFLLQFQQSLASPIYGSGMANALAGAGQLGVLRGRRAASMGNLAPGWDYLDYLMGR